MGQGRGTFSVDSWPGRGSAASAVCDPGQSWGPRARLGSALSLHYEGFSPLPWVLSYLSVTGPPACQHLSLGLCEALSDAQSHSIPRTTCEEGNYYCFHFRGEETEA